VPVICWTRQEATVIEESLDAVAFIAVEVKWFIY